MTSGTQGQLGLLPAERRCKAQLGQQVMGIDATANQ